MGTQSEPRIIALALVLKQLGADLNMDSRSLVWCAQRRIYLAYVAGYDLGYFFYLTPQGPYSAGLAEDCEALSCIVLSDADRLQPHVLEHLARAQALMVPPAGSEQEQWLDVLNVTAFLQEHLEDTIFRDDMRSAVPERLRHAPAMHLVAEGQERLAAMG
jgi:hypothetical protein